MLGIVCIKLLWNSWVGQSLRNMSNAFRINCSSFCLLLPCSTVIRFSMLTQQTNVLGLIVICLFNFISTLYMSETEQEGTE